MTLILGTQSFDLFDLSPGDMLCFSNDTGDQYYMILGRGDATPGYNRPASGFYSVYDETPNYQVMWFGPESAYRNRVSRFIFIPCLILQNSRLVASLSQKSLTPETNPL